MSMAAAMDTHQPTSETVFQRAVAARASLYAVIDAAREPDGPSQAEQAGLPFRSLLAGELGGRLRDVAPYLVEFRTRSQFARWWFGRWGKSAGVLLEAPVGLAELRTHLRTLLIVRHEDGRKYYFRFYDPRVLRVFLPSCTADEGKRFFGPITAIHCDGQGGEELLTFRSGPAGVSVAPSPVPVQERVKGRR